MRRYVQIQRLASALARRARRGLAKRDVRSGSSGRRAASVGQQTVAQAAVAQAAAAPECLAVGVAAGPVDSYADAGGTHY